MSGQTIYGTDVPNDTQGGTGNDFLTGASSFYGTQAGGGQQSDNDTLRGLGGADTIYGNAGSDCLDGGAGNDLLFGGDGDDTLRGGLDANTLAGGAGNDRLEGSLGIDVANYGANSSIQGVNLTALGSSSVTGSDGLGGTDSLLGVDIFAGGAGNDTLTFRDFAGTGVTLLGGVGADSLTGSAQNDSLDGGGSTGFDTVSYATNSTGLTMSTITGALSISGTGVGSDTLTAIERIQAGSGADTLSLAGFGSAVTLIGGSGNDSITGSGQSNLLDGGIGADTIIGGSGNETFLPGGGDDSISGGGATDLASYAGNNTIQAVGVTASVGNATVTDGQLGSDTLTGIEQFAGGAGNDAINFGGWTAGAMTIAPGAGNDVVFGSNSTADAVTYGALGPDAGFGPTQAISIVAGAGALGSQVTVIGGAAGNDTLSSIEQFGGGLGNDTLNFALTTGAVTIMPGGGADSVIGTASATDFVNYNANTAAQPMTILGAAGGGAATATDVSGNAATLSGFERFAGGAGADSIDFSANALAGAGNITILGNAGNDSIIGGGGNDSLDGGGNTDLVSYANIFSPLTMAGTGASSFTLSAGGATGIGNDSLNSFEQINAGTGSDSINLGNGTYTLASSISGNAGNDTIIGGSGNDTLVGGAGSDSLDGGVGTLDLISYAANTAGQGVSLTAAGGSSVSGGDGLGGSDSLINAERFEGGAGADTLNFSAWGGAAGATLSGNAGDDVLTGGAGNDSFSGGDDDDQLFGQAGDDTATGGNGNDTIYGSTGNDRLDGGTGAAGGIDRADYSTNTAGQPLNLTAIGASSITGSDGLGGSDTLIGIEQFAGGAGNDTFDFGLYTASAMSIAPGGGSDSIIAGSFVSTGNARTDLVTYFTNGPGQAVSILGVAGAATANDGLGGSDSIRGAEQFGGGAGNDTLDFGAWGAGSVTLMPGAGSDSIIGGSGEDIVSYAPNDTNQGINVTALPGNDTLIVNDGLGGLDTIVGIEGFGGGLGNDTIDFSDWSGGALTIMPGGGADSVIGGGSTGDAISYGGNNANQAMTIIGDAAGNATATDSLGNAATLIGFEAFAGGSGNDSLDFDAWTQGAITLQGFGGNDTALGGTGNDLVIGGAGNDSIDGNDGADTLTGNEFTFDANGDINGVTGGGAPDTLAGGLGDDTYVLGLDGDVVDEAPDAGFDTALVNESQFEAMTANVEVLGAFNTTITGSFTFIGNDIANTLYGAAFADSIEGGIGADSLGGNAGDDTLVGDAGSDSLTGGTGSDLMAGGTDNDLVDYGANGAGAPVNLVAIGGGTITGSDGLVFEGSRIGSDTLVEIEAIRTGAGDDTLDLGAWTAGGMTLGTGAGNDSIAAGTGADTVLAGTGADTVNAGDGADSVDGGDGADTMFGGHGDDTLLGGADTAGDTLNGGEDNDSVVGGGGDDVLLGGGGNDTVSGGDGSDTIYGMGGAASLDGGDGIDLVSYADNIAGENLSLSVDFSSGAGTLLSGTTGLGGATSLIGIEQLAGGEGADTINFAGWGAGALTVTGGAGNDVITGGISNDSLDGGADIDTASYEGNGPADPILAGVVGGAITTSGPTGSDTLTNFEAFLAGGGDDTLDFSAYTVSGLSVSGADGNDLIAGGSGSDSIDGGFNADSVAGGAGDDTLQGGDGSDTLVGGTGDDSMDGGGSAEDLVDYGANTAGQDLSLTVVDGSTITGSDGLGGQDTLTGFGQLQAGAGADTLNLNGWTGGALTVAAGDGNDLVGGGNGSDSLDGGNGADTATYAGNTDLQPIVARADGGAITVIGTDTGDDTLSSFEAFVGGAGGDSLNFLGFTAPGVGGATVVGGAGDDRVLGSVGNDLLDGGDDNDILSGGAGNDTLLGGAGNDSLTGGPGSDSMDGGTGEDIVSYLGNTSGQPVDLSVTGGTLISGSDGSGGQDTITGIEQLAGGLGADTLNLAGWTGGALTVSGGGGNDLVSGGNGSDSLDGGAGNDTASYAGNDVTQPITAGVTGGDAITVAGSTGADSLTSFENFVGGAGNDTLNFAGYTVSGLTVDAGSGNDLVSGGGGSDSLDGGVGADTASYAGNPVDQPISANAVGGDITVSGATGTDSLTSFENFVGGAGNDTLDFSGFTVPGLGGASVSGGGGADSMLGSAGNDLLDGGDGNDSIAGGEGSDTVLAGDGADSVDGGAGSDSVDGGEGNDTLLGGADKSDDTLAGGLGDDILVGGAGNDSQSGGDGNDLIAVRGADTVDGGDGDDVVTVGPDGGTSRLDGGTGDLDYLNFAGFNGQVTITGVTLTGGAGGDTNDYSFSYTGPDGITGTASNFRFITSGGETIDLSEPGPWGPLPVCFAAGTDILTSDGEVLVENLEAGSLVATVAGRGSPMKPVLWVGRRRIRLAGNPHAEALYPVRVRAGALGEATPHRDLLVSPDHCLYLDGALVPARLLVNGETIVVERGLSEVTYFHVELEAHDVLLANGAAAESWLDAGNRAWFENAGLTLLAVTDTPDAYATAAVEPCAPVIQGGERLGAIRDALALQGATQAQRVVPARQAG